MIIEEQATDENDCSSNYESDESDILNQYLNIEKRTN